MGERWYWAGRHLWSLRKWDQRLNQSSVSIWALESGNKPVGYYELEEQESKNIEIL